MKSQHFSREGRSEIFKGESSIDIIFLEWEGVNVWKPSQKKLEKPVEEPIQNFVKIPHPSAMTRPPLELAFWSMLRSIFIFSDCLRCCREMKVCRCLSKLQTSPMIRRSNIREITCDSLTSLAVGNSEKFGLHKLIKSTTWNRVTNQSLLQRQGKRLFLQRV